MNTHTEMEILIQRYLSGDVTRQEAQQMQEWLRSGKENRQLFAMQKKLWLSSRVLAGYDANKIEHDRKKTDLKIRNSELQLSLRKANTNIRILASVASVLLLLGITSVLYLSQQDVSVQQELRLANCEIEVPYGSKSLFTLPDGSKVWVNAGSKITYPADFGVTSRSVNLSGEAYFEVAKMEEMPFFVNTDMIKIKVYGTAFNVKAYMDDDLVETTLNRGAISIIRNDAPDREISVKPNQKYTVYRETQKNRVITTPSVSTSATVAPLPSKSPEIQPVKNVDVITAWKDNLLVFEQEPIGSLAKQLERRYNIQIRFADEKVKAIRFTAAIKEMPVDQVFEAIALSSPIKYRINGTVVTLSENKNFIRKQ